jgi:hypothetical protein
MPKLSAKFDPDQLQARYDYCYEFAKANPDHSFYACRKAVKEKFQIGIGEERARQAFNAARRETGQAPASNSFDMVLAELIIDRVGDGSLTPDRAKRVLRELAKQ